MTTLNELLTTLNKVTRKSDPGVQVTLVMKPNRGKRDGDGTGTQTRVTLHRGDTYSGPPIGKSRYIQPSEAEAFIQKTRQRYGKVRVCLEVREGDQRRYPSTVV